MDRFLIVGSGGRETAFASRLAEDSVVYAVMDHENPLIIEYVERTDGSWAVCNTRSPAAVTEFAKSENIDYVFVSADEPLAAGWWTACWKRA